MTAGFERMARSAGGMERISLPIIRGLLAAAPRLNVSYDEGGRIYGGLTQAEMGHIFCVRHSSVADFQHIKIVPCSRLTFGDDKRCFIHNIGDRAMKSGKAAVPCVGTITDVYQLHNQSWASLSYHGQRESGSSQES